MSSIDRQSSASIADMIRGCQLAQMISVIAKLRIADHLRDGPLTASNLAELTNTNENSLYRLLRALAGLGLFAEELGRRFRLTPASEPLLSGEPGSMRLRAEVIGEPWFWNSWGALLHTVQTGETAFDHLYGQGTFDWFREHPEPAQLFNAFQAEISSGVTGEIVDAYDFSQVNVVVDVGGGTGTLLREILRRSHRTQGMLFDLEHAIDSARKSMEGEFASRCELISGDMFQNVPEGGDLYVLKSIIHDWDDERAKAILSSCRRAMGERARLLLVEALVCAPNQACEAKMMDVLMMVRTGGRERTLEEYQDLLDQAGFRLTRVLPTSGRLHLVEAASRV